MGILEQIARGGNAQPMTAYLQGQQMRQQQDAGQLNRLAQQLQIQQAQDELRNYGEDRDLRRQATLAQIYRSMQGERGKLYQFVGDDGKPQYGTAEQAMGREPFSRPGVSVNVGEKPPYSIPQNMMLADPANPMKGVIPIPGSKADPDSPSYEFSEGEKKSGGFASRMVEAEKTLGSVRSKGFDPSSAMEKLRAGLPLIGNYAASTEFQEYRQAQEDWVRAKLRRESGAVIGEQEMADEIRTYFPQPGDSPATVAQKRRARVTAMQAMIKESGGFYDRKLAKPPERKVSQSEAAAILRKYGIAE